MIDYLDTTVMFNLEGIGPPMGYFGKVITDAGEGIGVKTK